MDAWQAAALQFMPPSRRWSSLGDLAKYLDRRTVQTPALDLIDAALEKAINTPDSRLIITMPPQEGKSQRVAGVLPVWLLAHNKDMRVVTASYAQPLATRNGRAVRAHVTNNPDLGIQIAPDNGAVHEWSISGHDGGVLSVGVGGGLTGRPADFLIIDDPIKDRVEADSQVYRDRVWDWWTDTASARLAPGAPVVLILTRWHHDDLAGRLIAEEGSEWTVLNIPAQCEDEKTDPLGRVEGEFMVSARGRTQAQWERRKRTAGSRSWASLYQGRPTPDKGNMFPLDGWARYIAPLWLDRPDGSCYVPDVGRDDDVEIVQSWDFTFKDTKNSDFVVGQVWLRRGVNVYLLDQVRRQATFSESCQMMLNLTAKWPQAIAKLVEDKANGPAIMNALRAQVGGMIPIEPEGSKYARASAITPFVEARNVLLPDPKLVEGTSWVVTLTEEARDFPSATHDDTVDGMSQAVHRLLLVPLLNSEVTDLDELIDEDLELAWAASY